MDIQVLLNYQNKDLELSKIESEVRSSEEFKNLSESKKAVDSEKEKIMSLTQTAQNILDSYNEKKQQLEDLASDLDAFEIAIKNAKDSSDIERYINEISSISKEIDEVEAILNKQAPTIEKIEGDFAASLKRGQEAAGQYKQAQDSYTALMSGKKPEVEAIQKELAQLRAQLPENAVTLYDSLKKQGKNPPVVRARKCPTNCPRCRVELSAEARTKLSNIGDFSECPNPNCGRILIVTEE